MSEYADGYDDGKGAQFDELMEEIVSLREQLKEVNEDRLESHRRWDAENAARMKAEAENAALRLDAERYRWLRDDKRGRSLSVSSLEWTGSAELSDAAVDAAKEEGK